MDLAEHPTVKHFRERKRLSPPPPPPAELDSQWLRQLCLDAGADDVGSVEADRPELAPQRKDY